MADTLILDGTHSLELSAKGAASDVRSWAHGKVGQEGARLFINNIAEPGVVHTIINRHRGNVGIGTSDPNAKLTVLNESAGPTIFTRNGTGDGIRSEVFAGHGLSGASVTHVGTEGVSESGTGVLGQSTRGNGVVGRGGQGLAAILAEGVFGFMLFEGRTVIPQIGTVFAVRSDGTVFADGPFTGPADFAEMMPAAGAAADFAPGDVLTLDASGLATRCTEAGSPALVGVYSTRPGFVGDRRISHMHLETFQKAGAKSDSLWLPVALVGIVPVRACADNGAIDAGDFLTTSKTPGHAMKAKPIVVQGANLYAHGTILGKALEPLTAGAATIPVLVSVR